MRYRIQERIFEQKILNLSGLIWTYLLLVTFKLHFELVTSYSLLPTKVLFLLCLKSFDLFNNLARVLSVFACVLNW